MKSNLNNDQVFRQTIASLDAEEVAVACEILVTMHPVPYFEALNKSFMSILKTNREIGSICAMQCDDYQRLIGNDVQINTLTMSDATINDTTDVTDASEVEIELDDDTDTVDIKNGSEVNVPSFLTSGK